MTSSAAAGVYLERHVANLRLGMTLELFTAIGALVGGSIAFLLDERLLSALFAGAARLRRVHHGPRPGRATGARDDTSSTTSPTSRRADRPRPTTLDRLSGEGYRVRNLGRGIVGSTGRRRGVRAVRDRWRDHQGAADEPGDGRPDARRDRHQQPDDRDHGGGQRGDLPGPRRDRPVRRRADRDRGVPRRDARLAAGPPGRPALPAPAVRGRPGLHRGPDAPAGRRNEPIAVGAPRPGASGASAGCSSR